ncbi:MAG TPA: hypothetical protein VFV19_12435 [Candidatus Polarisedimenticolaceae bacterium]|nr:hypothetical protein [Candidatus Polarisedimenticolaceae bacterium]
MPGELLPIVCNLDSLTDAERARRAELAALVRAGTLRVVENETGYSIHLRPGNDVLERAEELIALERRCCGFMSLTLRRDDAVLELSGREGTKAFIAAELDLL